MKTSNSDQIFEELELQHGMTADNKAFQRLRNQFENDFFGSQQHIKSTKSETTKTK